MSSSRVDIKRTLHVKMSKRLASDVYSSLSGYTPSSFGRLALELLLSIKELGLDIDLVRFLVYIVYESKEDLLPKSLVEDFKKIRHKLEKALKSFRDILVDAITSLSMVSGDLLLAKIYKNRWEVIVEKYKKERKTRSQ